MSNIDDILGHKIDLTVIKNNEIKEALNACDAWLLDSDKRIGNNLTKAEDRLCDSLKVIRKALLQVGGEK